MARFNFWIDDDAQVVWIRDNTGRPRDAQGKAEAIRDALSLYSYLLQRVKGGEEIFVGKTKDNAKKLIVTIFK